MAFYRCGGGSGEVHGATIIITCADGIGQTCSLYLGDELKDSKLISSGGSVYFEEILEIGTYTAKVTIEGTEYTADVIITAENVVNKENVSAEIAMKVYLYNEGDECTDITGGYAIVITGTELTKTTEYMEMKDTGRNNNYLYFRMGVKNTTLRQYYAGKSKIRATGTVYTSKIRTRKLSWYAKLTDNSSALYSEGITGSGLIPFDFSIEITDDLRTLDGRYAVDVGISFDNTVDTGDYVRISSLWLE